MNRIRLFVVSTGLAFAATFPFVADTRANEPVAANAPQWKATGSFSLKVGYDSNVFVQDTTPDGTIPGAVRPRHGSMITTTGAALGVDGRVIPALKIAAGYTLEDSRYQTASSENNLVHRVSLGLSGSVSGAPWTLQSALTAIDGGEVGPTFGGPGGVAAVGAIPLRDRRAALIERSSFQLIRTSGRWFVRPVATLYVHDFFTQQSRAAGYENYLDRQEWTAGVDFGREMFAGTRFVAGYRYGRQDQLKLYGVDSPYDSSLQRFLVGLEGTPAPWLRLNLLAGPETRRFGNGTAAGFDPGRVLLWIDATAVLTPDPRDTCTMAIRRFEQPAFASCSVYEDITYEISWRRKISNALTAGAGCKLYGGDWPAPVNREDWILTPSLQLSYAFNRHGTIELAYGRDRADSRVPNTAGREYRRELISGTARYAF